MLSGNVPGTVCAYRCAPWERRSKRPGQAPVTTEATARRFRLASPATALVLGGLVLMLMAADVPLARLAHQSLNSSGGSAPAWFSAPFGAVGFVVAWRQPRNPLGWILLGVAAFGVLSEDASFYAVADYRLGHGGLPLGWVALLAQPGWAPTIVLVGVTVLLFPDGRPPSPRWRWVLWAYLAVAMLWIAGAAGRRPLRPEVSQACRSMAEGDERGAPHLQERPGGV